MSFSAWLRKVKVPTTARQKSALKRPSLFLVTGAGLLLLGMLIGFYLFFPAEVLRQRIIQEVVQRTGVEVQIGQVALYPLLTFDVNRIRLDATGWPRPLEIEELKIAPQWSTLLSGDPGAQLQGRIMNGTVTASLQKSGIVSARATGLRFDVPLQKPIPFNIVGILNDAVVDSSIRLGAETKTDLSLSLTDVSILGLEAFNRDSRGLTLGEITLQLDGVGRALRINVLTARGGDLEVNGDGTLQVGRTTAASRIKLALQVRPGPNADPAIASMLQLVGKPGSDGRYSLQLSGTLDRPVLKPGD